MGTHDSQSLKSEADILARSSRPQHNSTWIPKTRDWRYATGVIQHDDHDDARKARSTWDILDYDYQASGNQRDQKHLSRSRGGTASDQEIVESTEPAPTPELAVSKAPTDLPKVASRAQGPYKPMEFRVKAWRQVKKFTRRGHLVNNEDIRSFEVTGLIVRMRFRRKNKDVLQEILAREVSLLPASDTVDITHSAGPKPKRTPPVSSPGTPAVARTAETVRTQHILDSIDSLYSFPLFKRAWVDETYGFNVKTVRSTVRSADKVVDDLGSNYEWYNNAVPADALFPPGVPLSAKEIHAFYPHHVRWKSVMVRLTNNDYRGPDIVGMQTYFRGAPNHHTPPAYMNNYQRDLVKTVLPGFRTATYKGKSDRNLRTDGFRPGVHIESTRKGYSLPTFEDLAHGLHRLPAGLDARGLTQCISWYLNIRDSFTPKLELNVLHTQSLIRALREPLKPFGPQNLDRNALEEWRSKGTFETTLIEPKEHKDLGSTNSTVRERRTQLRLDLDEDDVSMNLTLPIRHIFAFPFLALHGVMSDALQMGIDKAEIRKAARMESELKGRPEVKIEAKEASEVSTGALDEYTADEVRSDRQSVQPAQGEPKKPYRIPKRARPEAEEPRPTPKKPYTQTLSSPALSTSYRPLAPAQPRSFHTGPAQYGRPWGARASPSAHSSPQPAQGWLYGRRDSADRQLEHPREERGQADRRGPPGRQRDQTPGYETRYSLGQQVDTYRPSR